jgi:glycosyltransferase involved in cell wall biosynthesis
LRKLISCLERKKPGAYLRFGLDDINAALGIRKTDEDLQKSFIVETRKSFLLSGENFFKALEIECPALGLSNRARAIGVSNREAIDKLYAVGACFLEWPIYSYNSFNYKNLEYPDLLEKFIETVKVSQPIVIFQESEGREANLKKLSPNISISVTEKDPFNTIDKLEEKILTGLSTQNKFPVIVLALGTTGHILVKRLLNQVTSGFILDLNTLGDNPFNTLSKPPRYWKLYKPRAKVVEKKAITPISNEKLQMRWEGPFLGNYSFSLINRELCSQLSMNEKVELSIRPSDTPFNIDGFDPVRSVRLDRIVELINKPLTRPAEIHISNHVQHPTIHPAEGRWVSILPWDYMSIPVQWVNWILNEIDEVWVPSNFVQMAFLDAGIPKERVAVVPNGVDIRIYKPNARKVKFNTRKSFKFLFVGGPFWRKGFDILLEAYGKAFTARDDVSLVIKSDPFFWTNGGTKRINDFNSKSGAPEIFCIIQSLDQDRMAGLYATCDCLVHPYRAEGFAISVAEGMASGLPVIVTGMGATLDFCNKDTAYLIPANLRRMSEKQLDNEPTLDYPGYAEPEVNGLVDWMRYVYQHPMESRQLGRCGMNKIRTEFTWAHASNIAVQRTVALKNKPTLRVKVG